MRISIDTIGPTPIYQQLRDQIILNIARKQLTVGQALPSVRRVAAELNINFHTVNKAYTALCDEGYINMDRRRGAVVAKQPEKTKAYKAQLSQKLALTAAEAICHGMSQTEFIALCKRVYLEGSGVEG